MSVSMVSGRRGYISAVAAVTGLLLLFAASGTALGHDAALSAASVSPRQATSSTVIVFSVTYTDPSGANPVSIAAVVDGRSYGLFRQGDGSTAKGVRFATSTTLGPGQHEVDFAATDRAGVRHLLDGGSVQVKGAAATSTPAPTPTPKSGGPGVPTGGDVGASPAPPATPRPTPLPSPVATVAPTSVAVDPPAGPPADMSQPPAAGATPSAPGDGAAGAGPSDPPDSGQGVGGQASPGPSAAGSAEPALGAGAVTDAAPPADAAAAGSAAPGASSSGEAGSGQLARVGPGSPTRSTDTAGTTNTRLTGTGAGQTGSLPDEYAIALGRPVPELLVRLAPSVATSSAVVTAWAAFGLFARRRRNDDDDLPPDEVAFAPAAAGLEAVAARVPTMVDGVDESLMPRWRRPSLMAARKMDPLRATVETPRLSFAAGVVAPMDGFERRRIRYRLVRLLDGPDELRSSEVGLLDEEDEVQLLERSGAYWRVLCPDGREGWLHMMTLQAAAEPREEALARSWTEVPSGREVESGEGLLEAYLRARGEV